MTQPFKFFLAALALVLSLVTFAAYADDTVKWKHPVEYTDASALSLSDIDGTVIRWSATPNAAVLLGSTKVPAPATSAVIPRDAALAGTVCYQAATLMKASAGGKQSGFTPSAWACKTIAPPPPPVAKTPRVPTPVTVE